MTCLNEKKERTSPFKVERGEVPSIHSVDKDGETFFLGVQKDFRRNPLLAHFIPENGRLAIAWVHLGKEEILQPHVHPIDSLILVAKGLVKSLGDTQLDLQEGDIFVIPAKSVHGFKGMGEHGFWGLSIQFEEQGLYEDSCNPLVEFSEEQIVTAQEEVLNLSQLLRRNIYYLNLFRQNKLFELLNKNQGSQITLDRFMRVFQVWSNYFQRMVLLQYINATDSEVQKIAEEHLVEEFGHNIELRKSLGGLQPIWDPILESLSGWFSWVIPTIDQRERIVLIHLVIENCATVFYEVTTPIFNSQNSAEHFKHHSVHDNSHAELGLSVLEGLSPREYKGLSVIQEKGWKTLISLFERMADLTDDAAMFDSDLQNDRLASQG